MLKSAKVIGLFFAVGAISFTTGWMLSSKPMQFNIVIVENSAEQEEYDSSQFNSDQDHQSSNKVNLERGQLSNEKVVVENDSILTDTTVMVKDSLLSTSDSTFNQKDTSISKNEGSIKILEEQLMQTRSIQVKNNIKVEKTVADSLLSNDLGINNQERKTYLLEFWKHPLNSKGYKMNGSKIVLYGIDPNYEVTLTREARGLILRAGAEKMILRDAEKFQKFTFVGD